MPKTLNDRVPNFRDAGGYLYLVRCFNCGGEKGRENYKFQVPLGQCGWCGWKANPDQDLANLNNDPH